MSGGVPFGQTKFENNADLLLIMAWGLIDEPVLIHWVQYEECADLAADFTALAGTEPLTSFTESCQQGHEHDDDSSSPHRH